MNPSILGRIVLRDYPELAQEILQNSKLPPRNVYATDESVLRIMNEVCLRQGVDPESIRMIGDKKRFKSFVRQLIIGVTLKVYQPEVLTSKHRVIIQTDITDYLMYSLMRTRARISYNGSLAILYYNSYKDFHQEVESVSAIIISNHGNQ